MCTFLKELSCEMRGSREREGGEEIASEGEATALFVARRIIRGRKEGKEGGK